MSRQMQLTVKVTPFYEKDFEESYPNLGRGLRHLDAGLVDKNPSLYELAGQVDTLLYRFDGTPLREVLLAHKDKLRDAYKKIQEKISEWRLSEADKLLYGLEDIFAQIESGLDS